MQLIRLSVSAAAMLGTLHADDYASVQYLYYNESDGRISVSSPTFEINKDFGVSDTLNFTGTYDAISGASPTYYDASSGASATADADVSTLAPRRVGLRNYDLGRNPTSPENVAYGNIEVHERRNALSAMLTHRFASQDELRVGLNWALEYDVYVYAGSAEYRHYLDPSKNQSLSLGLAFEYHANLVPCGPYSSGCDASSGSSEQIDSQHYNLQLAYTRTLDPLSQISLTGFFLPERGYLSNPYKNVVRDFDTAPLITNEHRPDSRNAGGAALDYSRGVTPGVSLHTGYRYYLDDWRVQSHTPYVRMYDQVTAPLRVELGYRYYAQSAASFYSGARDTFTDEPYASSDDRLSDFNAFEATLGLQWQLSQTLTYNLSGSYYAQSTGLIARYLVTGLRLDF